MASISLTPYPQTRLYNKHNTKTETLKMTKQELLSELLHVERLLANYKRGEGNLTALKAYQRKIYRAYAKAS